MVYSKSVNIASIVATSIGIALFRALVEPALRNYRTWKIGPRTRVARRNWRGLYVPDLMIIRTERVLWFAIIVLIVTGMAVGWTVMVPNR